MSTTDPAARRAELESRRADRLDRMLAELMAANRFYQSKFKPLGFDDRRLPTAADLASLPLTRKAELAADQDRTPPFGTNLTYPIGRYTRLHQTSGTTGRPLRWLDTATSWDWFVGCWEEVYRQAGVTAEDRIFCAFSFGPFLGFWGGFEAAHRLGALALTGGAMTSEQRIEHLLEAEATVLLSTPTYALRLAEVARQLDVDLRRSRLRITLHAGEPGAGLPAVKRRIEEAYGARCVDHAGATEVGAWGFGCGVDENLHINEAEFLPELLDPSSGEPIEVESGSARGELVLTNLGRLGSPVVRYCTGDLVELYPGGCPCGSPYAHLAGGVLARVDDMLIVRGVNVYPAAIENVVRELQEVVEFEIWVANLDGRSELTLAIETSGPDTQATRERLLRSLRQRLSLRVEVEVVALGSLPRYELKARRVKRVEES